MSLIIDRPQPCTLEEDIVTLKLHLTSLEENFQQDGEALNVYIKSANTGTSLFAVLLENQYLGEREGSIAFKFPTIINDIAVNPGTHFIIEVERVVTGSKGTTSIVFTTTPFLSDVGVDLNAQLITFNYNSGGDTTSRLTKYKINIKKNEIAEPWETSELQITNSNEVEYRFDKSWVQEETAVKYQIEIITWSNQGFEKSFDLEEEEWEFKPIEKAQDTGEYVSTQLLNVRPRVQVDEEYGHISVSMPLTMRIYGWKSEREGNTLKLFIDECAGYGIDRRIESDGNLRKLIKVYENVFGNSLLSNEVMAVDEINKQYVFTIPFDPKASKPINFCIDVPYYAHFYLYRQEGEGPYYKVYDKPESSVNIVVCHEVDEHGHITNLFRYEDCAVDHGSEYNYAVAQYKVLNENDMTPIGLVETRATGLLDNIMLSDSTRELKIKFNPKINSLKTIIQEQKIDTIGGKYPFFFRNGDTRYKEMPLSGLISYTADEQMNFMPDDDSFLKNGDEFYRERIYKREVEDWLNNGQPKLLRTAAEGSFFVRLMNVSLTPIEALGRRLHSFSATAYEIAPVTVSNLKKYGLSGKFSKAKVLSSSEYYAYPGNEKEEYRWIKVGSLPKGLSGVGGKILINFEEYRKVFPQLEQIKFDGDINGNIRIAYNGEELVGSLPIERECVNEASASVFEITDRVNKNIDVYIGYRAPKLS